MPILSLIIASVVLQVQIKSSFFGKQSNQLACIDRFKSRNIHAIKFDKFRKCLRYSVSVTSSKTTWKMFALFLAFALNWKKTPFSIATKCFTPTIAPILLVPPILTQDNCLRFDLPCLPAPYWAVCLLNLWGHCLFDTVNLTDSLICCQLLLMILFTGRSSQVFWWIAIFMREPRNFRFNFSSDVCW